MRLVTFKDAKGTRLGALDEAGQVLDLLAADAALPQGMLALIAGGETVLAAARAAATTAPVVEGATILAPTARAPRSSAPGFRRGCSSRRCGWCARSRRQ